MTPAEIRKNDLASLEEVKTLALGSPLSLDDKAVVLRAEDRLLKKGAGRLTKRARVELQILAINLRHTRRVQGVGPQPDADPPDYHPYANIFPMLLDDDERGLAKSIAENGLREPVILFEGKILDGRNRWRGCIAAGVSPRYENLPADADPLSYVIDRNLRRRHLTTSQRAMIAAELGRLCHGGDRSKPSNEGLSADSRAKQLKVGRATVERAQSVVDNGTEELKESVKRGGTPVSVAAEIAKLPQDQQRAAVEEIAASADGRKAVKAVAKRVRAEDQVRRHVERQDKLEKIAERNPSLPAGRLFSLVYIDVPRKPTAYSDETGQEKAPPYPTMTLDELCDFAIDRFAAEDAVLLFWSTAASLIDDLEILAEWGFVALRPRDADGRIRRGEDGKRLPPVGGGRYGSHQIWRKVRGGEQTGMGRWFREDHELLIVARRGNVPAPLPGTQARSIFDAEVAEHSAKPDKVRAWIDRCWPKLSKIEVFARGTAPNGWTFWGNQAAAAYSDDDLSAENTAGDDVKDVKGSSPVAPAPTTTSTTRPATLPVSTDDELVEDIPDFLRIGHAANAWRAKADEAAP